MTDPILQLVDPNNLASVLFDLNDPTGSANPGTAKTFFGLNGEFALNAPETEFIRFQPQAAPGGSTAFMRDPLVASSWRTRMVAPSVDDLVTAANSLGRLLKLGGVLKWVPRNSAYTRYVDFEPSTAPALYNGMELELYTVMSMFDTPKGVTLVITRQPLLRGPELDPNVNILVNSLLLADQTAPTGTPDSWAWDSTTGITGQAISVSDEAFEFIASTVAARSLQQTTPAASVGNSQTWTLAFDARVVGGSGARMQAAFQPLISAGTANGAEIVGGLVILSSNWRRITVTGTTPATLTNKALISLRIGDLDTTAYTIHVRNVQFEQASSASLFVCPPQAVSNDPATGGRSIGIYVQGDAPAPVKFQVINDGGSLAMALLGDLASGSVVGRRFMVDYLNTTKFAQCEVTGGGWTVSLGTDTTNTATDANDSGGRVARVSYATNALMARRVRLGRTTNLDSLRGSWDVYVRCKAQGADLHTILMRWGPSANDPPSYFSPAVTLDRTAAATMQREDLFLGTIWISPDAPLAALTLELWSSRATGGAGASLDFDVIFFVPHDLQARLVVPGQSARTWLGSELTSPPYKLTADPTWVAGLVQGTQLNLNQLLTAGGTPTNAGLVFPVGQNIALISLTYAHNFIGEVQCRVVSVGGGGAGSDITHFWQVWAAAKNGDQTIKLQWTADGSTAYQIQVVINPIYTQGRAYVNSISWQFSPVLGASERFVTDPTRRPPSSEKGDTASKLVSDVPCIGPVPFWLEPGLHIISGIWGDAPALGQPSWESILTRSPTIKATYAPRYYT